MLARPDDGGQKCTNTTTLLASRGTSSVSTMNLLLLSILFAGRTSRTINSERVLVYHGGRLVRCLLLFTLARKQLDDNFFADGGKSGEQQKHTGRSADRHRRRKAEKRRFARANGTDGRASGQCDVTSRAADVVPLPLLHIRIIPHNHCVSCRYCSPRMRLARFSLLSPPNIGGKPTDAHHHRIITTTHKNIILYNVNERLFPILRGRKKKVRPVKILDGVTFPAFPLGYVNGHSY